MYEYKAKIIKIVDGDTVDVDIDLGFGVWLHNERVRLAGLDTPESRTKDNVEKVFGLAAKQRLSDLLPVGSMQVLVCTEYDSKGKFGRILGDFKIGDNGLYQYVVNTMIEECYGVAYHGQSKDDVQAQHIQNRVILLQEGKVTLE